MAHVYDILSPDGFSIDPEKVYQTEQEAEDAFNEWKKRYERQGYYSSNHGRIALEDLRDECSLIKLDPKDLEDDEIPNIGPF